VRALRSERLGRLESVHATARHRLGPLRHGRLHPLHLLGIAARLVDPRLSAAPEGERADGLAFEVLARLDGGVLHDKAVVRPGGVAFRFHTRHSHDLHIESLSPSLEHVGHRHESGVDGTALQRGRDLGRRPLQELQVDLDAVLLTDLLADAHEHGNEVRDGPASDPDRLEGLALAPRHRRRTEAGKHPEDSDAPRDIRAQGDPLSFVAEAVGTSPQVHSRCARMSSKEVLVGTMTMRVSIFVYDAPSASRGGSSPDMNRRITFRR
jgi:hypothetical protein